MRTPSHAARPLLTAFIALALAAPLMVQAQPGAGQSHRHGQHAHGGMLAAMDQDKDGQLSREEASEAHRKRMALVDADGDGVIAYEEMQAYHDARREQRKRDRFARMDADGDGKVSVAELAAGADRRFARMDRDADGMLSRDDVRMNRQHRRMQGGND